MAKKATKGALRLYKSYNFVDKDPVIDRVRSIVAGKTYKEIAEKSGVSITTLHNWFDGQTKRPQFATVAAVVRAMGGVIVVRRATATEAVTAHIEKKMKELAH